MFKVAILLDRRVRNLWVAIDGLRTSVTWDVDGVEKAGDQGYYRVMRKGRQVGIVWDVERVCEQW